MNCWTRWFALTLMAVAATAWLTGCGKDSTSKPKTEDSKKDTAKETGHKDGGHKEGEPHGGGPLTDVKMPDSFKAGVSTLEDLHKRIDGHIDAGHLDKVHPVAEKMKEVATKMKELAQKDLPEDKRVDAGKLCNEMAGYYKPIDEAADAGKKPETVAIYKKMGDTIKKMKELAPHGH